MTGYVTTSTYNEGQAEQNARIDTLESNSAQLPTSVRYTHVEMATMWAADDEREDDYASIILPFPYKTFPEHPTVATVSDASVGYAEVLYLDGTPVYRIEHSAVVLSALYVGAGVQLTATVPRSSLPVDLDTKSHILHFVVHVTIS